MSRWSLLLLLLHRSVGDEAGIDVVIEATAADVYYALPYALFALRRRGRGFVGSITVSYAAAERCCCAASIPARRSTHPTGRAARTLRERRALLGQHLH